MVRESEQTGAPVYLSLAHLPASAVHERFPAVAELCRRVGLDIARDRLPVSPAAHYLMGGVAIDLDGRTSLPGLFAAGEAAVTGVHGANRLASNSLLEGLVFGGRAGAAMRSSSPARWPEPVDAPVSMSAPVGPGSRLPIDEPELRTLMWQSAGVFRNRDALAHAAGRIESAWTAVERGVEAGAGLDAGTWRLASLVTVGRLIVRAALRREESRGAHSRTDFPERDDLNWKRRCYDQRAATSSLETRSSK
jgi:L-aspartate oxidase